MTKKPTLTPEQEASARWIHSCGAADGSTRTLDQVRESVLRADANIAKEDPNLRASLLARARREGLNIADLIKEHSAPVNITDLINEYTTPPKWKLGGEDGWH